MAARQTKRERKELAKKQRLEEMRRAVRRRRTRRISTLLATVVAIAAIVGLYMWNKDRNEKAEAKRNATINAAALALGGSPVRTPTDGGQQHIQPPAKGGPYTSEPPTSGRHYNAPNGGGPAFTGVHPETVQDELQIHNLEHGHIGIQYNPTKLPAEVKKVFEDFTNEHNTGIFMAPRANPEFKDVLAVTAWRKLVSFASVRDDPTKAKEFIQAFYDQYIGRGPEPAGRRGPVPGQPRPA